MINHVVLFKLKTFPQKEKEEKLAGFKLALEGLVNKIPEIKFMEVGLNYQTDSKSFDIVLLSHFNSVADLDTYSKHPEHLKVVSLFSEVIESRAAVDYEF